MTGKGIHIMLIGPVTNVSKNLIGGASISFGYLVDYLERSAASYTVVNTKKYFSLGAQLINPVYIMFRVLTHLKRTDVVFLNSSRGGTKYLAPLLYGLTKLSRKKFVFRPFGGNIDEYTSKYNRIQKWIFKSTVLQADIFFLQTQKLLQHFSKYNANTVHLPTSRNQPDSKLLRDNRPFQKRFIYLGHLRKDKGIDHILEATKELGEEYTIDIYGPIQQNRYDNLLQNDSNYKGILSKDQVLNTLSSYDVLLLPTYYEGEGYPGAIIEAYSLGLPVISTSWKSIPEIVKDGQTGVLIPPKSTVDLIQAIRSFNQSNYSTFSNKAQQYFLESFYTERVNKKAINQIYSLFGKQQIIN